MSRIVNGLGDLSKLLTKIAVEETVILNETMAGVSHIVEHHVKENFGDKERLATLSQYTQDERVELGYSPDEPLLRDGKLLRDQVEREHLANVARVGTPEIIQGYHELGYINARTGRSVPPRQVFRLAVGDSKDEVIAAFEDALEFIMTGRAVKFMMTGETD